MLLDQVDDPDAQLFYAERAAEHGWSRGVLEDRIAGRLYERDGRAPSTFSRTLPTAEHRAAQQLARDPWLFDFLHLDDEVSEADVERALVANLARFLTELGSGFAYLGRQYRLLVGEEEFFLDLLFYHVRLHRYVVFELKVGKFPSSTPASCPSTSPRSTSSCVTQRGTATRSGCCWFGDATRRSSSTPCMGSERRWRSAGTPMPSCPRTCGRRSRTPRP